MCIEIFALEYALSTVTVVVPGAMLIQALNYDKEFGPKLIAN